MRPLQLVLDTNVVLDWLVFRNPGVQALTRAIESGAICWLTCAEMRAELAHVLAYGRLGDWKVDAQQAQQVLTSLDGLSRSATLTPVLPTARLRGTDISDQMFVDLAVTQRARWLLTRDRALLKLAREAAPLGLLIQRPEAWPGPSP